MKSRFAPIVLEKISLVTSDECIESNVIPIEAKKFLEEDTAAEAMNNIPVNNEQDGDDEDLVCRKQNVFFDLYCFLLVLV